ncbi:PVC-type heme-binding CxxCH protein [Cecembia rubra]|uniref:PVC-type heme-binding CxxCH protein n=1 Tax=Cecembia rubra TaxID=1485585 RepID=UPI0027145318|nr:PVC-type heme-binding CxxCH protein [Cecembia rubra]
MNYQKSKTCLTLLFILLLLFSCKYSDEDERKSLGIDESIYAEHVRSAEFQSPEEEMRDFILPPGFEVTLFASEPDIGKPINMAFDEKGRLWVSQSFEYPFAAEPGKGKDRISVLEDTNGDGKADKITHFADDLNIPIGLVPVKGGAIAYSIPNVYRFWDDDGDDVADRREVLLGPFEHKDTHGMVNNLFRGFDGWIHASHGFSNISRVSGKDRDSILMVSGNTFRFREDGSRAEKTSDGRINPFGSDYDEMGYHYSADCHTLPIYQLIWGGNYSQWGKQTPNMGFAPEMMDYGLNSTALSGLVYYTDDQFPEAYRNSFYSGDVVTCRISRNTMEFQGSTPKASRQEDFLISKDPWFRPVDIKIGPDGAMYVADFYNRIIGHYEVALDHPGRDRVSGRIWKITYKGNQRPVQDWSKANLESLIQGMGHSILQIRMTATDVLVDKFGEKAIPELLKLIQTESISADQMVQVHWALFRLGSLSEKQLLHAMGHNNRNVRLHAYRILAEYPDLSPALKNQALKDITDQDPHVQRASAEMFSRRPGMDTYEALVKVHSAIPSYDTHLDYTVRMGLYHHLRLPAILNKAVNQTWNEQESKLLALVVSDIPSQASADFLLAHVQQYPESDARKTAFAKSMAKGLKGAKRVELLAWAKSLDATKPMVAYKYSQAMAQGFLEAGEQAPAAYQDWQQSLATAILSNATVRSGQDEEEKAALVFAMQTAGIYKMIGQKERLLAYLDHAQVQEDVRAEAGKSLMMLAPQTFSDHLGEIITDNHVAVSLKRKLAPALGIWDDDRARLALARGLKNAPPELQESIAATLSKNSRGKTVLLEQIQSGNASARILTAGSVQESFLSGISPAQKQQFQRLTENLVPVSEERQQLIDKRLASFEPNNEMLISGGKVYEQHCGLCHQMDNKGGLIGPQLDGVGNWGKVALATKILDPNRNITENFRTYNIAMKNGQSNSGLFRRDQGQTIVFANQVGEEFAISKAEMKEMAPSKFTLMPDNFHAVLSEEEFKALLSYLLSKK